MERLPRLRSFFGDGETFSFLNSRSHVVVAVYRINNNVASRIEEAERLSITKKASESWETLHFASAENDTEVWKELFGPRFKVED